MAGVHSALSTICASYESYYRKLPVFFLYASESTRSSRMTSLPVVLECTTSAMDYNGLLALR